MKACFVATVLGVAAGLALSGPAAAQTSPDLGSGPWSRMSTLLQKTFLKVDVLTVDVCFDDATAAELGRIARMGRLQGALGDSVARATLRGQHAAASIEFVRDVSLHQFLDGIDEDQRKAVSSGFLPDSVYRRVRASLPVWFGFLEEGGIRKGDRIHYTLEPEAIRTRYVDREGVVRLNQRDEGRERRNSVLATWLAPGSSFRSGLLRSVERSGGAAAQPRPCG
jgi:hypothetical protein